MSPLPPPPPSEDDFYASPSSLPMPAPPEDFYQVPPPPPVVGQSWIPKNYIEKGTTISHRYVFIQVQKNLCLQVQEKLVLCLKRFFNWQFLVRQWYCMLRFSKD